MLNLKKICQTAAAMTISGLPILSLAQETSTADVDSVEDVYDLVLKIATWIQAFFFIIAAIFIIFAAFGYLTAGGDEDKVKSAKQKLVYAIVAIVVAVFAFAIKSIVAGFIGSTDTNL